MKTLTQMIAACVLAGSLNLNACSTQNKPDLPDYGYDSSTTDTGSETEAEAGADLDADTDGDTGTDADTDADSDSDSGYDAGDTDSETAVPDAGDGSDSDGDADSDTDAGAWKFDFAGCTQESQSYMVAHLCDTPGKAYIIMGNVGPDYNNILSSIAASLALNCGRETDAVSAEDYTDLYDAFTSDNVVVGTYDTNKALQEMYKGKIFFEGNLTGGKIMQAWKCRDETEGIDKIFMIIGGQELSHAQETANNVAQLVQAYAGSK